MFRTRMKGEWAPHEAWIYAHVVAKGLMPAYEKFAKEGVPAPDDGASLLDVGCGAGQLAWVLAMRYPACSVLGIDLSPTMIRHAKRLFDRRANLRFEIGDALNLPVSDGSIDIVTCVASLKHWPDQQRGMREIRRVLKPDGTMCILELDENCSKEAARRFVARFRYLPPGLRWVVASYFQRFVAGQGASMERLVDLATSAGFANQYPLKPDDMPCVYLRAKRG